MPSTSRNWRKKWRKTTVVRPIKPSDIAIAVLGAGSWGTALAILLSHNQYDVRLWGHIPEEIERLQQDRQNQQFLPDIPFPESLRPETDLDKTLSGVSEVLVAVPSHAFSTVVQTIAPLLAPDVGVSWATKGFEPGTQRLLSDVATDILQRPELAVISGPTFAGEVARGLPTAVTVASESSAHAERVAAYLHAPWFRAYTSHDITGVQVGGASKNVLAIAAGIADGLGFGANTRAALITRGLAEVMRLGQSLGGKTETFMGLAGLGDLVLTCTDNQSRNRRMGLALARGLTIAQAKEEIGQEVEGVQTASEVYQLARKMDVEMPISEQVYKVLYEGLPPKEAVHSLLDRRQRAED
ncbi:MAG: NAD(P)-dependent glycerol-3-phosphate dehydrogenase [Gammaproteobacteria bacterium (ex Lamellibrachia satsuma)]|nr:MAG: NAD(P)-dependent glycerol-3-phosphate dehydrogenase [Gammaproteobacteria bacterium (ex Lamellibrachia satsuma)]